MSSLARDSEPAARLRWDIFCRVIDNFGDIGVCWRLAATLAQRGHQVRLWADDASALQWMAPKECDGVQVRAWTKDSPRAGQDAPGDVVIEAFGCEIDPAWIATHLIANYQEDMPAKCSNDIKKSPVWINLEYLTAEDYAQRSHGLPSPIMSGPAQGMSKWFFYPGFKEGTGGVIHGFGAERLIAQPSTPALVSYMPSSIPLPEALRISLFCYEPPALLDLLTQLNALAEPVDLRVTAGRAWEAVQKLDFQSNSAGNSKSNHHNSLSISEQPRISQPAYDALLSGCQLNFVRGEDSLVRALLAGRAFIWQIYPQQDGAHAAKLEAFLHWLQAPPDLVQFHRIWNGLQTGTLPALNLWAWTACAQAAQQKILAQSDLVSQLLDFVEEKRAAVSL